MTEHKEVGAAVIISYFPFICQHISHFPTTTDRPTPDLIRRLAEVVVESARFAEAKGCLWVEHEGLTPVLMIDKAQELYDDLTIWAESKHASWLTLDWCMHGECYVLALIPKFEQSVRRFKLRYLMEQEEIWQRSKVSVLFQPLRFFSANPNPLFYKWSTGKTSTKIGLLDPTNVDLTSQAMKTEPLWIGPLEVKPNSEWVRRFYD